MFVPCAEEAKQAHGIGNCQRSAQCCGCSEGVPWLHLAADTVQHGAVNKGSTAFTTNMVRTFSGQAMVKAQSGARGPEEGVPECSRGVGNGADTSTRSLCGTPG